MVSVHPVDPAGAEEGLLLDAEGVLLEVDSDDFPTDIGVHLRTGC